MTVTYNPDPLNPYSDRPEVRPLTGERLDLNARPEVAEEPFVPVYARRGKAARRTSGKVPTWMILAPIGVIALGAVAALMLMDNGGETTAPLAEPAATAPVVDATPLTSAAPLAAASTPAPVTAAPAPAPVVREATPVRRATAPAPVRRATAPAAIRTTTAPAARVVTPAPASPTTSTLNTARTSPAPVVTVTPAPEPTPPAPVIVVQPLD
ncbi:MAG TPA: hypothetical protein VF686_07970 [Brevundimonas sp.]